MKRGFTLIELLAVIVILAIIALIATPIILGIIKDARESANQRSAELYLEAVKLSVARNSLSGGLSDNNLVCEIGSNGTLTCNETEIEVDVTQKATGGTITFTGGIITNVEDLAIGERTYELSNGVLVATGSATPSVTSYTIAVNITNGTSTGATTIDEGGNATVTLSANSGYALPSTITVTGAQYTYNDSTGVVTLSNPTGNVIIAATPIINASPVTVTMTAEVDWVGSDAAVGVKINSAPENDGDFDYRIDTSTHDWFFISAADATKSQYWTYGQPTATLSNVSVMYLWLLDYAYGGAWYSINGGEYNYNIGEDYTNPGVVTFSGDSTVHFVLQGD